MTPTHNFQVCGFEHLHLHTAEASILDGFGTVQEYARRKKEINQQYFCVSDHGSMGAIPSQIGACDEHKLNFIAACLPKGSPIITKMGIKPIEEIKIGDDVLTHKGRFKKVLRTSVRPFKGLMYEIKLSDSELNTKGFKMTEEHPILIRNQKGIIDFIKASEIITGRRTQTKKGIKEWNSFVCFPRTHGIINHINTQEHMPEHFVFDGDNLIRLKTNKYYGSLSWKNFPKIIELNHDFSRLLGLFCAEGCTSRSSQNKTKPSGDIRFTFNYSELKTHATEVVKILNKVFPEVKTSIYEYPKDGSCEVILCCLPLAYLLRSLCGVGAHNKKIPNVIFNSSDQIKKYFLSGLFDGDGKNPNKDINQQKTLKIASINLAYGTKRLLADLGEWINVTKGEDKRGFIYYNLPYSPFGAYRRFLSDESYVFKPIREIKSTYEECDVYNFEVEEDNSYVGDFVMHNCELYVNDMQKDRDSLEFMDPDQKKLFRKSSHLLAIAYNNIGYTNLVQLCSWAHLEGFYQKPRTTYAKLMEHKEGIIFTSCCISGEIGKAFTNHGEDAGNAMIEKYMEMFGENFYLELMMIDYAPQKPYDEFLIRAHEKYGIPLILSNDCHYTMPEDSEYQRYMLMIQTKRTIADIQKAMELDDGNTPFELQDSSLWMKSEEELNEKWLKEFSHIIPLELFEEAKRNTVKLCEKAKGVKINRDIKLPQIPDAEIRLWEEALKGIKLRRLDGNQKYFKRLKQEYDLICRKDFASYFLIEKNIVDEARRICPELLGWGSGDYAVGSGRGSGVSSLICYLLRITDIDPIEHGLLFSRFLSENRGGRTMKIKFANLVRK